MFQTNYIESTLIVLTFMHFLSFCTVNSQKYSNVPRVEDIPDLGNALQEGLIYVKNYNETKTLDVALGIMLVKGSLHWIRDSVKQRFTLGKSFLSKITELLHLCKGIFSELHRIFQASESSRDRKFFALLRHIFYDVVAEDLKYGNLIKNVARVHIPSFENCSFITSYALKGTPNDSDSCIIELFEKSCNTSFPCWFQETNQLDNAGYKTSHRLLYLQLAMKLQCGRGDERIMERMKKSLCERMLEEAISLYGKNMFFARDLFLEQIALCGFEGYAEFADRNWSREIQRWQNSDGCFGVLPKEQHHEESCFGWRRDLNKRKRDGPCSAHLTAVALSAIAFHLRVAFDQF